MKRNKLFFSACFIMLVFSPVLKAQINMVPRTDPDLVIEEKYDNPYRASYNLGATFGVDVGASSGAVYLDIAGHISLKRFMLRFNNSIDMSKGGAVSSEFPLFSYAKPYSNFQVSGFFNFKDNVEEVAMTTTVGWETESVSRDINTTTVTGYNYGTDEELKVRKTMGFGGSIINLSLNNMYTATSAEENGFVTFTNPLVQPSYFILPYSATIIGIGLQTSIYKSYNIKYKYKDLQAQKLKESAFKVLQYEVLFAPSIRHDASIPTMTNSVLSMEEVSDAKKNPLGIRFLYSSNQYSGKKRGHKPGLFFNAEAGLRPGIYKEYFPSAIYMRLGVGLTL